MNHVICSPVMHYIRYQMNAVLVFVKSPCTNAIHDYIIKWKHFPRYWPIVLGINCSPVNSPHKGQWRGALMFSLICTWINRWVNNRAARDLRRHRALCDVIVMWPWRSFDPTLLAYNQLMKGSWLMFRHWKMFPKCVIVCDIVWYVQKIFRISAVWKSNRLHICALLSHRKHMTFETEW